MLFILFLGISCLTQSANALTPADSTCCSNCMWDCEITYSQAFCRDGDDMCKQHCTAFCPPYHIYTYCEKRFWGCSPCCPEGKYITSGCIDTTPGQCSDCTNAGTGEYYTSAGGTSSTGCGKARCDNIAGQYYTSAGTATSTSCSKAACTNGLSNGQYYTPVWTTSATGCTTSSCTNAGIGQTYSGSGGISATGCPTTACSSATAGRYYTTVNSCATATCTNTAVGKYWSTGGGTTNTSCTNTACTNAGKNQYYTSHGGSSSTGCGVQSCTNAAANQYYSGSGGSSAPTTNSCPVSTCTTAVKNEYYSRNTSTTAAPTTNACPRTACTNAKVYQYYSGAGGSSAPVTNSCPVTNCTNVPANGFYWSGGGGLTATSCATQRCNNTLLNNQYYSSNGDVNPQGCQVSTCLNMLLLGQYYSNNGFATSTGCAISSCTNKPVASVYTPGALNLGPVCAFQCVAGYYLANATCAPCPASTFSAQGAVGACSPCVAGVHYPQNFAVTDITKTALTKCEWVCNTGYSPAPDGSALCLVATTTSADRLAVKKYALVLDQVNSTHTRFARLNFTDETTESVGTVRAALAFPVIAPTSSTSLFAYAVDADAGGLYSLRYDYPGPVNATLLSSTAGLRSLAALPRSSDFAVGLSRANQDVLRVDLPAARVTTIFTASSGAALHAVACSPDGTFAVFAMDSALYRLPVAPPYGAVLIAGSASAADYLDGAGTAARFRAAVSVAVSPDGAAAFVVHPAASSQTDCVLRRVDLGASPATVTTVLRHSLLSKASLSFGLAPARIWAASPLSYSVTGIDVVNATAAAVAVVYGNNGQGVADDVLGGFYHTEKFQSPSGLSVYACGRPGYDCGSDPLFALPCAAGRTSDGVAACLPCSPGTFAPAEASASCTPCGAGKYADFQASTTCYQCLSDCAPGTYRSQCGGASQGTCAPCQACPADQFVANCSGFSPGACAPCPTPPAVNQYFFPSYAPCTTAPCTNPLSPGDYWSYHGGTLATNCSASPCANKPDQSIYTPTQNLGPDCAYECMPGHSGPSCSPCANGTYAQGYASPACAPCFVGSYAPSTGLTACLACPRGAHAPLGGSAACALCGEGTYAPSEGSQNCLTCAPGSVSFQNSSACQQCQPGYIAHPANLTHCQPCPPGSASSLPGMTACSPCRAGYVAASANSSCTACGAGQYAAVSSCLPCSPGTYSAGPVTACSTCPTGQVPSVSAGSCAPCGPGTYANASSCSPCPPNTFSLGSVTACSTCPSNQVPSTAAGPCASCQAGYAPQADTGTCAPCPRYTYSAGAAPSCTPCVQGAHYPSHSTLTETTGNAACDFRCDPGYILSASRLNCVEYDTSLPSVTFEASVVVPSGGFSDEDPIVYRDGIAVALGVSSSYVFTTLNDDTLSVIVQSQTQDAAAALAATVQTSAYQRALNQQFSAGSLAVPVVDTASVQTSFEIPAPSPPPSPSPPSPSPPSPSQVPSPPTQFKSDGRRAPCLPTSHFLVFLALAQKILGDNS